MISCGSARKEAVIGAALVLLPWLTAAPGAEITLPSIFADHMVMQTGQPIQLSGRVLPAEVSLEIELAGERATVKPGLFGNWSVELNPIHEIGGSHTLSILADDELVHRIEDITFGDVWLCGGQSNMSWEMTTINNSAAEIAAAHFPNIRLMEVSLVTDTKPRDEVKGLAQSWTRCTPATVRQFSGVGFLFGREIHQATGRPIGLIQSAWGGSRIETWIPDTALVENPYGPSVKSRSFGNPQHRPSICYNAMIHGLAPLALKGVIWYQGESNQDRPEEYRSLHETLITSWRDLWQRPELPFYYVQLANYAPGRQWERLREAQTQSLAIPHTGMAVTIDIGDSNDIHPRNKQGTAHRLAAIALARTYDQKRVHEGPTFRSAVRRGDDIILHFDGLGSGLVTQDGTNAVTGFERLTKSGDWTRTQGAIDGDTIVIRSSIFSPDPQGIRYGWESDPEVNLANAEGLPAVPFQFGPIEITYSSWQDRLVGPASRRLPSGDADGDGTSNLLHYATAGRLPIATPVADTHYTLTFHRRSGADDIGVAFEESHDLRTWTPVWVEGSPEKSSIQVNRTLEWGAVMTDSWSINLPVDTDQRHYFRIRYALDQ